MDKRDIIVEKILDSRNYTSYAPLYATRYDISKDEFISICENLVFDGQAVRRSLSAYKGQGRYAAINFDPEYKLSR